MDEKSSDDREDDGSIVSDTERSTESCLEGDDDEYSSGCKGGCGQNSSSSE
jgi:hypothetical protein